MSGITLFSLIDVTSHMMTILEGCPLHNEPNTKPEEYIKSVLEFITDKKCSDLKLTSGYTPFCKYEGNWRPIDGPVLEHREIVEIYNYIKGRRSADASLEQSKPDDFSYQFQNSESKRGYYFRVNATGVRPTKDESSAIDLIFRVIPGVPPDLDSQKLDRTLKKALIPDKGLVLVVGATGSGKTTLLGSIVREICTTRYCNGYSYEDPPEYDYSEIPGLKMPVLQSEVHKHISEFKDAGSNILRRSPDMGIFGEVRDLESIRNLSIVASYGHLVYATVHASSVAHAINRLVGEFDAAERHARLTDFVMQTRLIVYQELIKKKDGRRVAFRSYVVLSDKDREELSLSSLEELPDQIRKLQSKRGTGIESGLRHLVTEGDLTESDYDIHLKRLSR